MFWATVAVSELLRWSQLMWGPLHRLYKSPVQAAKLMISSLSLSPEKSAVSLRWQQTCSMCDCHKWIWAGSRAISLKCIKFSLDIVTQNWCFLKSEQKLLCLQYFTWVYMEMRTGWQCIVLMISLHLVQSSYTDIWAPSLYCQCSESEDSVNVLH